MAQGHWLADVAALLTGRAVDYTRPGSRSAIAKLPTSARLTLADTGLYGDEQGDLRVHGGPDKAVHHYPYEHYRAWRSDIGGHALLDAPGAFGENISTVGVTEADLCLGDQLLLGTARVEVSQSRQPCWKPSDRFGIADMARQMQDSGRTGWYYRVLEPGEVQAGDALILLERPFPQWTLARLIEVLYRHNAPPSVLEALLVLPLVPSWRRLFERRLAQGTIEDWNPRLNGPAQQ